MMATTSDISGNIVKQTVKRALEEVLKEKAETTNESQNKLWDKDKLILIFYIGIGDLRQEKAYEILQHLKIELDEMFDESVKSIIMPVSAKGGDIRVEPIYMQTITNNENNNRLTETINKLEQAVKNLYDTQIA